MATIDLTLNGIKIPALDGYTPPFGTKVVSGGLTTQEVNDNVIAPFVKERAIEITEDSSTGNIEYNANLVITTNYAALTLGSGSYQGCKVTVSTTQSYAFIKFNSTSCVCISKSAATFIWNGSSWAVASGATFVMDNTAHQHTPAGTKPSYWADYIGTGTYTFTYSYDADTTYNLPHSNCNIIMIWRYSGSASALAEETYITTGEASKPTRLWTTRMQEGTWSTAWVPLIGGGNGTVHTVTTFLNGYHGSAYWTVQNGICHVSVIGFGRSSGDGRIVAYSNMPTAKVLTYTQLGVYGNIGVEGSELSLYQPGSSLTDLWHSFSYPVADTWQE